MTTKLSTTMNAGSRTIHFAEEWAVPSAGMVRVGDEGPWRYTSPDRYSVQLVGPECAQKAHEIGETVVLE